MAQYLLAIFARDPTGRHTEPFADLLGQGDRWGDYVFNQEGVSLIVLLVQYSFLTLPSSRSDYDPTYGEFHSWEACACDR